MKKFHMFIFLVSCTFVLSGTDHSTSNIYKISVQYVAVRSDSTEASTNNVSTTNDIKSSDSVKTTDLSNSRVTITYNAESERDGREVIELASGTLVDGEVVFEGEIEEATFVTATVTIDGVQLSKSGLITPGGPELRFALIEKHGMYPTHLLLMAGNSNRATDPRKSFTITGDFNSLDQDMTLGIVRVSWSVWTEDAERYTVDEMLLMDKGMFFVEADVREPAVWTIRVTVYSNTGTFPQYFAMTRVVVEPGVDILISPTRAGSKLLASATKGRHAYLVDSWQQSKPYLDTVERYVIAYQEAFDKSQSDELESDTTNKIEEATEEVAKTASDTSFEDDQVLDSTKNSSSKNDDSFPILALVDGLTQAEGCEHVVLDHVLSGIADTSEDDPEWYRLSDELSKKRSVALEEIAISASDPINSLLALELGAFAENKQKALTTYERLATTLDEELVARRITSKLEDLAHDLEVENSDKMMVPGQKVPDFKLPTLDNEMVALYDVLAEKKVVLIDFWASWCGPCVIAFPKLKELYEKYNSQGFEIVGVSIDATKDAWESASVEHELSWINVGEMSGWEGTTARQFGVKFIPKSYLIDSNGCILRKDLDTGKLAEVLALRYGDTLDSQSKKAVKRAD